MKNCVIDIGSNSVRLMLNQNGVTVYKKVKMTRLAEHLGEGRFLSKEAMLRTVNAVVDFVEVAKSEKPDNIYVFATAAVRLSVNGNEVVQAIKDGTGIDVDVVSGELEALLGVKGALKNEDGTLIDIGGGSTEISFIDGCNRSFSSYPLGASTFTELLKTEDEKQILDNVFSSLKNNSHGKCYAVGGTATSIVAMILQLEVYDSTKVHGYFLCKSDLKNLVNKLKNMTEEQISLMKGLQKGRESIICAGAMILLYLMEKLSLDGVLVSEDDNLEGYLEYVKEGL